MTNPPSTASPVRFSPPRTLLRRRSSVHRDIAQALETARATATVGLHLGAGNQHIANLVNCDLYNPAAERRVDSCNLHEFSDQSVDYIEHHHMFEHLSFIDTDRALKEWWRVLKYDGLLVMTFPDIFAVCRRYFFDSMINKVFDRDKQLEYEIKMIVGSQENVGMFHRNHYDRRRISRMLPNYGFNIEFFYNYPNRRTPSLLTIARKAKTSDSIH